MGFWEELKGIADPVELGEVTDAHLVEVEGVLTPTALVTSPVRGERGVLVMYRIFNVHDEGAKPIASGALGEALVIQTGEHAVRVPYEPTLEIIGVDWTSVHVPKPTPRALLEAYSGFDVYYRGDLLYEEAVLELGARVGFRGVVEPSAEDVGGQGAYRGGAVDRWDFLARAGGMLRLNAPASRNT